MNNFTYTSQYHGITVFLDDTLFNSLTVLLSNRLSYVGSGFLDMMPW